MASKKVLKGFRYWMRFSSSQEPIVGSLTLRKKKPSAGIWYDVTDCLYICCEKDPVSALNASLEVTTENVTHADIYTLMSASTTNGETLATEPFSLVINGVTVDLDNDGTLTVTTPAGTEDTFTVPVTFTAGGKSTTVLLTLEIDVPE